MPNHYIFNRQPSIYAPLPSLADSKSLRLSGKLVEKQKKLAPPPVEIPQTSLFSDSLPSPDSGSGLLDMAEASLYRGAGNIADSYANVQQNVLGNEDYALSPGVDNLSNPEYADGLAGYTGRAQYNKDVQELTNSVGQGNIWDSIKQGAALSTRALADSAASGAELLAGSLATGAATLATGPIGGAVTGAAIFGNKAKKVVDTVDKVVSMSDRVKKGIKAVPKSTIKTIGRTSLLTADLTEQMRQDYKAANNGQEPSAKWYATNIPISIALNALELGLISKAIPKFNKKAASEVKDIIKFMDKSSAVEAAKRIVGGAGKIASAAGMEAGQEYLQTWQEILAPVVSGDTLSELITSSVKEWGKDENQTQAIVGAILGFGAGGVARGVATVPTVAAGLAKDTVEGTVRAGAKVAEATGKKVKESNVAKNLKLLSTEEREAIRNKYEVKKQVMDERIAVVEEKITAVDTAKTFEDIVSGKEVKTLAEEQQVRLGINDEDLNKPENLRKIKDGIIREQRAGNLKLKAELELSNAGLVAKQTAKDYTNLAVDTAVKAIKKVPESVVLKTLAAIGMTKEAAESTLKAVKELKSGTALGIIEMGIRGTPGKTKQILEAAQSLELRDLKRVAEVITEVNPELGEKLLVAYDNKKAALQDLGEISSNVVNKDNLSPIVSDVVKIGTLKGNSAAAVAFAIKETLGSKINDKATLYTVKKALQIYKESEAFTNKDTKGRISDNNMLSLEGQIVNAEKRLSRRFSTENVGDIVNSVVDTVTDVAAGKKVIKDSARAISNKARMLKARGYGPEAVTKLEAEIAKEDEVIAKQEAADKETADKLAKEKEVTVPEETLKQKGKKVVEAVVDSVKKAVNDPKIFTDVKKIAILDQMSAKLKEGDVAAALPAIPAVVKILLDNNYVTEQDFNDFVEQFPEFKKNEEFYTELKNQIETDTDVIMQENTDNIKSEPADSDTAFNFFAAIGLTECK